MKYDVFISYRREDGKEYARQIQLKLENYGYSVFLDVEELKDGVFDKRITDAIRSSKVFIALLTPKYLCRSHNPQDWVRKEIECAVYNDIHIVPVNIDRLWTDFPVDCPDNVRQHLGQHQYSEIFTGSQFTNTMNDLNEHRLRPYIKVSDIVQPTTGALLRVRADMDCRVVKYGEDVGLMFAGKFGKLRLKKGKHLLDFISTECPEDHLEMLYTVEDSDFEDFMEVSLKPKREARLKAEQERIAKEKAEAERIAKEKAEAERLVREKAEAERLAQMVKEGKGRDGVYQVGDYYNVNGKEGVVFDVWDGGRHGKIVSLDQGKGLRWEDSWRSDFWQFGTDSKTDGKANTDKVMAMGDADQYPAFTWCRSKGNDWYLPAIDELKLLLLNNAVHDAVNKTLVRYGGTKLFNKREFEYYWSSTESDRNCAWSVRMYGGDAYSRNKHNDGYVRAVSAF